MQQFKPCHYIIISKLSVPFVLLHLVDNSFCPRVYHNPLAIKLLVSGFLTRHILCTFFYTDNRFCIYFLYVPC